MTTTETRKMHTMRELGLNFSVLGGPLGARCLIMSRTDFLHFPQDKREAGHFTEREVFGKSECNWHRRPLHQHRTGGEWLAPCSWILSPENTDWQPEFLLYFWSFCRFSQLMNHLEWNLHSQNPKPLLKQTSMKSPGTCNTLCFSKTGL